MEITESTKIDSLLGEYPFLVDFLPTLAPEYSKLRNPVMRKTVGSFATMEKVARMGDMELPALLAAVADEVERRTGERPAVTVAGEPVPAAGPTRDEGRRESLKGILRDLHAGEAPEALRERFRELIAGITPGELAEVEQSLIDEGLPEQEVKRLCTLHVEVFKEGLDEGETPQVPGGHPVHTFMMENRAAENLVGKLESALCDVGDPPDSGAFQRLRGSVLEDLRALGRIEVHYARKENQLFPALEQHGITGPTSVMWAVHDDIRSSLKRAISETESGTVPEAVGSISEVTRAVRDMVYKEEHILFPMSLESLSEAEWVRMRRGEGDIGYAWVQPSTGWEPRALAEAQEELAEGRGGPASMDLDTGHMTAEQVNLLLKHLPVDVTFVDEAGEVAYFSATPERIFPRSPGIIGRKVSKCHPPKSVHVVERIVDSFRSGERDVAEFWLELGGRFIHIRYFAVRDEAGAYRGTLEVSQDLTALRALEGERRLLDWD